MKYPLFAISNGGNFVINIVAPKREIAILIYLPCLVLLYTFTYTNRYIVRTLSRVNLSLLKTKSFSFVSYKHDEAFVFVVCLLSAQYFVKQSTIWVSVSV